MEEDNLNRELNEGKANILEASEKSIEKDKSTSIGSKKEGQSINKVNELQQQIEKLEQQKKSLEKEQKLKPQRKAVKPGKEKKEAKKKELKKANKPKFNLFKFIKKQLNKEKKQNQKKGGEKLVARVSVSAKNTVVDSFLKPNKSNKKANAMKVAPIQKPKQDIKVTIDYKAFTQLSKEMQKLKNETAKGVKAINGRKSITQKTVPTLKPTRKPTLKM